MLDLRPETGMNGLIFPVLQKVKNRTVWSGYFFHYAFCALCNGIIDVVPDEARARYAPLAVPRSG